MWMNQIVEKLSQILFFSKKKNKKKKDKKNSKTFFFHLKNYLFKNFVFSSKYKIFKIFFFFKYLYLSEFNIFLSENEKNSS